MPNRNSIPTILLTLTVLLGGCAVGNVYDYRTAEVVLPLRGTQTVSVSVTDKRPYVLNGKKQSNFVGLRRGGYGNPFNVTTASGAPLAEELAEAIRSGLVNSGYAMVSDSATRSVELVMREWKSDVFTNLKIIYDLDLLVRDEAGNEIARNTISGEEAAGGGAMMDQHNESVRRVFDAKMSLLFSDPSVRAALEG